MGKQLQKRIIIVMVSVVALLGALLLVRFYILSKIKTKLEDQLHALRDSGYLVKYDSISVNTKENEVNVYNLSIQRDLDSAMCSSTHFFASKHIKAEGFNIMPLLLKRKLSFETISVESPQIVLHKNFFIDREASKKERREFSIAVKVLNFPGLDLVYYDTSSCKPYTTYSSNSKIKGFILSFFEDRKPYYNIDSFYADSVELNLPTEYYTIKVKETRLDLEMGILDLDTLRIMPHLNKVAFGRKKGKQVDRIEALIPYVNMYGISLYKEDSMAFHADKMTTQMFLRVFRDKRLPFKNNLKPLPTQTLVSLPLGLDIDSLVINKSFVEYEEFAEEAETAGRIFFDNIYAAVKNISNLPEHREKDLIMNATGEMMGQGNLKVKALMPLDPAKKTRVAGSLKDMDFDRLNILMEPHARIKAESGRLNSLSFKFSYDNNKSTGELEMDYNNLKLTSFRSEEQIDKKLERKNKRRKEKDLTEEDVEKAPFKTFVLNTFIIRKNMDENMKEEKKTGQIEFYRDKRRSMFNYWSKSMFSGIKSAYNIDKLEDSRVKKLLDKKNQP